MANVIGGGVKIHIKKYRGVSIKDGRVALDISQAGRTMMACGGRNIGMYNAVKFAKYRKEHPEWCCKKCTARFDALILEAKKLKDAA